MGTPETRSQEEKKTFAEYKEYEARCLNKCQYFATGIPLVICKCFMKLRNRILMGMVQRMSICLIDRLCISVANVTGDCYSIHSKCQQMEEHK